MKKCLALLLALALLVGLVGCEKSAPTTDPIEIKLPDFDSISEEEPGQEDVSSSDEAVDTPKAEPQDVPELPELEEDEMTLSLTYPQHRRLCAGAYMTAILKEDGTVISNWDSSQCEAIAVNGEWNEWKDIVDLSLFGEAMMALKSDGTVVWCGGRTDEDWWANKDMMGAVYDWKNIVQVSAGIFDLAALDSNGDVYLAGTLLPYMLEENSGFVQISMGDCFLGLRADGTVYCYYPYETNPYQVEGWKNVVQVSAGWDHAVALRADGTVLATGNNDAGQCDVGDWTDIVQVCAGRQHTLGLRSDGTVVATGKDYFGELQVSDWTDIVEIDGRFNHTVGLKRDGTIVYAGDEAATIPNATIH